MNIFNHYCENMICLLNLQHVGPKQHAYLQAPQRSEEFDEFFFWIFIHLLVSTETAVSLFVLLRTNSKSTMSCALKRVWELFAWEHEREVKGFSSKPKPVVLLLGNVDGGYEYCLFPPWAMYWIQCVALLSEGLCEKIPIFLLFHEGLFK